MSLYLYEVAQITTSGSEIQMADERQSIFTWPPDLQLVRSANVSEICPITRCNKRKHQF